MTDKQRGILKLWLTEDRIENLSKLNYRHTVDFVDMILHFTAKTGKYYHSTVPVLHRNPTDDERKTIGVFVNAHRKELGMMEEEDAWLKDVCCLPNGCKWYLFDQQWYKGMSNTPSHRTILIADSGEAKFEGVFNVLFDSGVYSIEDLVKLYADKLQQCVDWLV